MTQRLDHIVALGEDVEPAGLAADVDGVEGARFDDAVESCDKVRAPASVTAADDASDAECAECEDDVESSGEAVVKKDVAPITCAPSPMDEDEFESSPTPLPVPGTALLKEMRRLFEVHHEQLYQRFQVQHDQAFSKLDVLLQERPFHPCKPFADGSEGVLSPAACWAPTGAMSPRSVCSQPPAHMTMYNEHVAAAAAGAASEASFAADASSPSMPRAVVKAAFRRHSTTGVSQTLSASSSMYGAPCWRRWMLGATKHPLFEIIFGLAIFTNAMFIGVETDYVARLYLHSQEPRVFVYIGHFYTVVFTVEIIMRILAQGSNFVLGGELWNFVDTFIVLTSLIEIVLDSLIREGNASNGVARTTAQFRTLRILRITRLIRLVRVTRLIRFIRALRTLVHQIVHTVKSLVWALLLLTLVLFLFGVVFTQGVTMHRQEKSDSVCSDTACPTPENAEALLRYWSTLPRSMFTLFKATTGGISWDEVVQPLSDISEWCVGLFVGYVSFTHFCVLNVVTGVFCQNAIDSAQHDQDLVTQAVLQQKSMYCARLRQIFKDIDADGSGTISMQEFRQHLEDESVRAYFDSLELDTSDVWTLFRLMDADNGSDIDIDEFIESCLRLRGSARGVDMAKLIHDVKRMQKKYDKAVKTFDERFVALHQQVANWAQPYASSPYASPHMSPRQFGVAAHKDSNVLGEHPRLGCNERPGMHFAGECDPPVGACKVERAGAT